MIRQMMRSMLCFWVVAVCLQLQVTTTVYGLDFERFLELVGALPACQSSKEERQTEQKFHGDYICDRRMLNDPVTRAAYDLRFALLSPSKSMKIPHEQTLYCPTITTHEALLSDQEASVMVGHKERWIIKNEATKPVSVSFWLQEERKLVSAFNPDISPAHHDQEAIIKPGEWTVVSAWQGHVFVMHQLEWVEGELVQDRILATHRVGLVPIGLNFEAPPQQQQMADIPLTDPGPHTTAASTKRTLSKSASTFGGLTERTPPNPMEEFCNVMYKGFINEANYPLDLYFAGHRSTFSNNNDHQHQQMKQTLEDEKDSNNLPPCRHKFKLHLGAHHHHHNNDIAGWDDPSRDAHHTLNDWESPLKYMGSYVSHIIVARFRHDPSIIVQEYTVSPVIVRDCSIQEENKESTIHQAATVDVTMHIIQDEISMTSFHIASSSLSNTSTILLRHDQAEQIMRDEP
eukprot:scaffold75818_cov54-Attheya_sp.AAC.3